ncbi:MAG: hypothetical protein K2J80_01880, partial [Oscillospiraceae bacterium]|nr:hypothetical protein [Oscillospiraceae bacterium]
KNGAGIGGGAGGSANSIEIYGNAEVTAGGADGAGIGGGIVIADEGGNADNILIHGSAKVKATGDGGAAIGSGSPSVRGDAGKANNIKIYENAYVEANGYGGVGIGGYGENGENDGIIEISGGTVIADGQIVGIGNCSDSYVNITISGGNVKASAADNCGICADTIEITGGSVTAEGGTFGISGSTVTVSGADTIVNAVGGVDGCGITGADGASPEIRIMGGTVKAEGGSKGIGSADGDPVTIRITGGTTAAMGAIGIGGADDTVYIRGTDSTHYPWVFTNDIESINYNNRSDEVNGYWGIVFEYAGGSTFTDKENNNFNEGIVYGTNKTVEITEDYTLTAGKKLTVPAKVTFATKDMFTVDGSVLYLEENAVLDKWYKMEKVNGGEIRHEDHSDYTWYDVKDHGFVNTTNYTELYLLNGNEGIVLCDICGTPEPHTLVKEGEWRQSETHHWHNGTCDLGKDCSVAQFDVTECSYMVNSRIDYGEHRYSNPIKDNDGKLHFYCIDCNFERIMDIPVVSIIKVDGTTREPLIGAEFSIYSNEQCTALITSATTAIAAGNNRAVISFEAMPNTTYYIKETKAPDGYRVSGRVYKAVVDADGKITYSVVGTANISEDVPVCENFAVGAISAAPAKIIKVDGNGNALIGAEFGIYSDQACTALITSAITAIDTNAASDTYNKATVSFNTALNTTYYIKETTAPNGYTASDTVFRAVVGADGKVTYNVVGSIATSDTIPVCVNMKYNESVGGPDSAKVIKVNEDGNALVGAEFGLYNDQACTALITTAVTAIDTDETSDTYNMAIVSFNTALNTTYYIKEISAPNGYTASDMVFGAVVGADGKVMYGVVGLEGTTDDVPICVNNRRSGDTSTPSGDTSTPSGDTSTPSGDTSTPSGDTSTPSGDTSTPSVDTSTPSGGTSMSTGNTSTPSNDSSNSVHDPDQNPETGISIGPAVFAVIAVLLDVIYAASVKKGARGKKNK